MKQIETKDLTKLPHNFQVRFALFCAYQTNSRWTSVPECVEAMRVVSLWLEGKASDKECEAASVAVWAGVTLETDDILLAVAYAAASAAYYDATYAVSAASSAAAYATEACYHSIYHNYSDFFAAKNKLIAGQWDYYHELLHCDAIAEKALLGEEI